MAEPLPDQRGIEAATMRKVGLRLIPFLALCYFIAYVDRVNVGFAALTMNQDLGLHSCGIRCGRGAVLRRLRPVRGAQQPRHGKGRRAALDRPHHDHLGLGRRRLGFRDGPISFSIARFLLGAAEAGFFPGVILYLTYWFPRPTAPGSWPCSWSRCRCRASSARRSRRRC